MEFRFQKSGTGRKTFTGWADAEGNALDQNMTMTQDAAYYAVWN